MRIRPLKDMAIFFNNKSLVKGILNNDPANYPRTVHILQVTEIANVSDSGRILHHGPVVGFKIAISRSILPVRRSRWRHSWGLRVFGKDDGILSHDYFFGTSNTTAKFHVWPWPSASSAAIPIFPRFLLVCSLTIPISALRAPTSEAISSTNPGTCGVSLALGGFAARSALGLSLNGDRGRRSSSS